MFLRDLLDKMAAVDLANSASVINTDVVEGEKAVGTMSEDLQRLYVVYLETAKALKPECAKLDVEVGSIVNKPKSECTPEEITLMQEHVLAHDRVDRIGEIFWHELSEEIPETVGYSRGVRKGWQVVRYIPKNPRSVVPSGIIIAMPLGLGPVL